VCVCVVYSVIFELNAKASSLGGGRRWRRPAVHALAPQSVMLADGGAPAVLAFAPPSGAPPSPSIESRTKTTDETRQTVIALA